MTLLTNPPGAIKTMVAMRALVKRLKPDGKFYAAPWRANGHFIPVVTCFFTRHSFMHRDKLCHVQMTVLNQYSGTSHYDFLRFHGTPPRITTAVSHWDFNWPNAFVFVNYFLAYAHAARYEAICLATAKRIGK